MSGHNGGRQPYFNQSGEYQAMLDLPRIRKPLTAPQIVDSIFLGQKNLPYDAYTGEEFIIDKSVERLARFLSLGDLAPKVVNFFIKAKELNQIDFATTIYDRFTPEEQHQLFGYMVQRLTESKDGKRLKHPDYFALVDPDTEQTLEEAVGEAFEVKRTEHNNQLNYKRRALENCYQY